MRYHTDDAAHSEWVASRLAELRRHAGLTQSQVGELMGVTGANVSVYESGKRPPKMVMLGVRANAVGYSARIWVHGIPWEHEVTSACADVMPAMVLSQIRRAAAILGVGGRRVAEVLGVSTSAVTQMFRSADPMFRTVQCLARALGGVVEVSFAGDPFGGCRMDVSVSYPGGVRRGRRRAGGGVDAVEVATMMGVGCESLLMWESGACMPVPVVVARWDRVLDEVLASRAPAPADRHQVDRLTVRKWLGK